MPTVLLERSVKWHVTGLLWNISDLIKMRLLAGNRGLILRNNSLLHLAKKKNLALQWKLMFKREENIP